MQFSPCLTLILLVYQWLNYADSDNFFWFLAAKMTSVVNVNEFEISTSIELLSHITSAEVKAAYDQLF